MDTSSNPGSSQRNEAPSYEITLRINGENVVVN